MALTGCLLAALVGLVLGRFLNLAMSRLAREDSGQRGTVLCAPGQGPDSWRDRSPLVGLFGKRTGCSTCQTPLPWRFPLMELAGAGLAAALWARFPGSPLLLVYTPFVALLLILTALDLKYQWLPDVLTLPGIALGLALALVLPHLTFLQAFLGALGGWVIFQGLRGLYGLLTRQRHGDLPQGLGGGDVKLLALIGAFLGLKSLPMVLSISALLGGMVGLVMLLKGGRGRPAAFPFGPCLAGAALITLLGK